MEKVFVIFGSVIAFAGISLGAFGAHALKAKLSADAMAVYATAVQYHLPHAVAIVVIGVLLHSHPGSAWIKTGGWLLSIGIVVFCGSLYLLAVTEIKRLGMITPIGGIALMLGWACVAIGMLLVER